MVSQRISQYIDYKEISVYAFENKLGVSRSSISKAIKENKSIGSNVLENILINYPDINSEWLLTGKGKMIKGDEKPILNGWAIQTYGVPLVSTEVLGGMGNTSFAIEEKDIQARYVVPDFENVDFMMRVKGPSMEPNYNRGDVVACRIIKERNFIQWNRTHVIATENQGILIKRLKKCSDKEALTAISDNSEYDPFEVPWHEIKGIALVIGVIRLE